MFFSRAARQSSLEYTRQQSEAGAGRRRQPQSQQARPLQDRCSSVSSTGSWSQSQPQLKLVTKQVAAYELHYQQLRSSTTVEKKTTQQASSKATNSAQSAAQSTTASAAAAASQSAKMPASGLSSNSRSEQVVEEDDSGQASRFKSRDLSYADDGIR